MSESSVPVIDMQLTLLPDELRAAVVAARGRLGDGTVMARVGEYNERPGLVSIERGGKELQAGLGMDLALTFLEELK